MEAVNLNPKINFPRNVIFSVFDNYANPLVEIPPLILFINPNTLSKTYQKKIYRYQTFSCFVEEFWGDELDSISCAGSTGAFYSEGEMTPYSLTRSPNGGGLTNIHKTKTPAYMNFRELVNIYKNNGNFFDSQGRITRKGAVVMSYHPDSFTGYFETFNYVEDANKPFTFVFDFVFKVEKTFTGI